MTHIRDPYIAIDDVFMRWAAAHGFNVGTQYRDDIVRSIWFYDQDGNQRAQMWLGMPDILNVVTVFVAEFRPDLPQKWGNVWSVRRLSSISAGLSMNLVRQPFGGQGLAPVT